jgi:hypothetical protein
MRTSRIGFLMLFLVLGVLPSAMAQTAAHAALPYPDAATPTAIDLGELKAQSGTTPISITIALRLAKLNEAEDLLKALHTPGDPQFHQFLTAKQFVARFAPASADLAKVIAALAKYGLTAECTTATTLKVTGLPADLERAFAVSLHSYEVPAHDNVPGYTFHAPPHSRHNSCRDCGVGCSRSRPRQPTQLSSCESDCFPGAKGREFGAADNHAR